MCEDLRQSPYRQSKMNLSTWRACLITGTHSVLACNTRLTTSGSSFVASTPTLTAPGPQ